MSPRGFKCKSEILEFLKKKYEEITTINFNEDYLIAIEHFDEITEYVLRKFLNERYEKSRSADQAWKSCKGEVYEYAIFKLLDKMITQDSRLSSNLKVEKGDDIIKRFPQKISIRNWREIFPDIDLVILDRKEDEILAILSCKTSLRERLTETAFWRRELQRFEHLAKIKCIFITTDKDEELKTETNRYILLHIIDYTIVTDPRKYELLISHYKRKYGNRHDFEYLTNKIRPVRDFPKILQEFLSK